MRCAGHCPALNELFRLHTGEDTRRVVLTSHFGIRIIDADQFDLGQFFFEELAQILLALGTEEAGDLVLNGFCLRRLFFRSRPGRKAEAAKPQEKIGWEASKHRGTREIISLETAGFAPVRE